MKRNASLAVVGGILISLAIGGLFAAEAARTPLPKPAASRTIPKSTAVPKPVAAAPKPAVQTPCDVRFHYGMCDASAAMSVGAGLFVAANDEDNRLRVYRRDESGQPAAVYDVGKFLEITKKAEADLEGVARLGNRIYWISSHGRNKDGEYRPQRHRLFATDLEFTNRGVQLTCVGRPYMNLLRDMLGDPRLAKYNLAEASTRAPKEAGALNIEGLAGSPDGSLWIGFRNPIPKGKAILLPLLNPQGILAGEPGKFGTPIELDLGGRGIRNIEYWQQRGFYLIVAGAYDRTKEFDLFHWSGKGQPTQIPGIAFDDWNPEAIIVYQDQPNRIQVLSDDGECKIDGMPCKKLPSENQRRFRSGWLEIK
ncbi:MAG: DUF3616 domain-containing protein [Pirellulales bacterium]